MARADRDARHVSYQRTVVGTQRPVDQETVRQRFAARVHHQYRAAERRRRLHQRTFQFTEAVAYARPVETQPRKAFRAFVAFELRIAFKNHHHRARFAPLRVFGRVVDPETVRDDAILEFAVAAAGRQVMVVRCRCVERDVDDVVAHPAGILAIWPEPCDFALPRDLQRAGVGQCRIGEQRLPQEVEPLDRIVTAAGCRIARQPVVVAGNEHERHACRIQDRAALRIQRVAARFLRTLEIARIDDESEVTLARDRIEQPLGGRFVRRAVDDARHDRERVGRGGALRRCSLRAGLREHEYRRDERGGRASRQARRDAFKRGRRHRATGPACAVRTAGRAPRAA